MVSTFPPWTKLGLLETDHDTKDVISLRMNILNYLKYGMLQYF